MSSVTKGISLESSAAATEARPLKSQPWFIPLLLFVLMMAVFSIGRLALRASYPDDFESLTTGQFFHALLQGMRFDASIILTFMGVPLVMLMLPCDWALGRWWRGFWGWALFIEAVGMTLVLGADVVYFGHVHRHTGPEALAMGADLDILWAYGFGEYLWVLLLTLAGLAGLGWLWRKLLRVQVRIGSFAWGMIQVTLVGLAIAAIIRGGLSGKPLNLVNAFEGTTMPGGYLVLNGPFNLFHSSMRNSALKTAFMTGKEADGIVAGLIDSDFDKPTDGDFPLMRYRSPAAPAPAAGRNVVIVMLESWDPVQIDTFRAMKGLAPLGATPNFDAMCRKGMVMSRFFANGQRSMDGISSILAGMPTLPGSPYIGRGMEQNRLGYMGHIAHANGYSTRFIQASKRGSYRLDAVSHLAGFEQYNGHEDIPLTGHTAIHTAWGAWDHDMFQQANRMFAAAPKPLLGFAFTVSTHGPYITPGPQWKKFSSKTPDHDFLNTLHYSDWALGQLFESARKDGYFDDTIWVLVTDHVSGRLQGLRDAEGQHHVPCVIVGPGIAAQVNDRIGSQADLIPTLMDLTGWKGYHSTFGRSLVEARDEGERFAYCVRGNVVTWIEKDGYISHNLSKRLATWPGDGPGFDGMEKRLLAFQQVVGEALNGNRVFREVGPGETKQPLALP